MDMKKSRNRIFAGVAGGIADYQKMNVTLIRAIWFVAFMISGGLAIGAYVVLAFIMPPPTHFDINDFRQQ